MQVGIVSDTHDTLDVVTAAVEWFDSSGVDVVVHCGDIVAPFSATPFDGPWEFYAVRGNNDGEWALRETVGEFGSYLGEMGELTLDGTEFAVYHGTSEPIVEALVDSGSYDYVLHGHTHERAHEERAGTVRINPGGMAFPGAPEPPAVAVLDTTTDTVEFEQIG